MAQPWAIYASIPAVAGANWLMNKVKIYAFGTGVEPVLIKDEDALDIQTTVTNLPLASGDNPAMVTWTLQVFLAG